uniref:Uncharacterized protein n=1 Tax=Mus musculus TaxID=10090 RepID=Q9D943_MOUSE|nr:unnamed protein product [Mus musculus]
MSGVGKQNRACWSGHTESNVLGMSVPDQVPNSTHLPLEQQVDESVCVCVCVCVFVLCVCAHECTRVFSQACDYQHGEEKIKSPSGCLMRDESCSELKGDDGKIKSVCICSISLPNVRAQLRSPPDLKEKHSDVRS